MIAGRPAEDRSLKESFKANNGSVKVLDQSKSSVGGKKGKTGDEQPSEYEYDEEEYDDEDDGQ